MESVKNNFEELKNLLLAAIQILEENNVALVERIANLEKRVTELKEQNLHIESKPVEEEPPVISIIENEVNDNELPEMDSHETEDNTPSVEITNETETQEKDYIYEVIIDDEEETEENNPEEFVEIDEEIGIEENLSGLENEEQDTTQAYENKILNEAARPDWYDWEVDYPAEYIDDIYKGISFNERYEFVKELFNVTGNLSEAEMIFKETLDDINEMDNFKEVVAYIRKRFPQWDEQSDEVYRFYMIVRRKFNK